MIQNKKQLFQRLHEYGPAIATFGARRFGLFGSFARGVQNSNSDVDMLVEFLPGRKSFDTFMKLSYFLEEILERKVDLLTPESLSPHIGPKILAEIEYAFVD